MRLFFNSNPIKTIVSSSCSSSLFRSHPSDSWWSCKSLYNRCCINFDHKRLTARTATMATTSKLSSMGVVAENEAGIARRFWIKFRKESILAMYTPFVVCLASGNLNLETFRHYIAQDVHFLKSFAQAYELAEECADDDDAKVAISDLRKSVLEELKMHDSFVKEWGSDMAKESTLNSAIVKYTEFLSATASGKVEGVKAPGKLATPFEKTKVATYTLDALTPCMRLYAFLGKELHALLDPDGGSHLYKKWIER